MRIVFKYWLEERQKAANSIFWAKLWINGLDWEVRKALSFYQTK